MKYKLGKNPAVFDRRTLRFGDYVKPEVEPPPASVDYGARVDSWPMYDNDRYGDCTCAAAGHMIQSWTANAGKEVTPSDQSVLEFYEHFVGTPPPPDAGCSMLEVLRYWRSTGVAYSAGGAGVPGCCATSAATGQRDCGSCASSARGRMSSAHCARCDS